MKGLTFGGKYETVWLNSGLHKVYCLIEGVKMSTRSTQQLEKLFDAKPVIVLEEIQKALGSASRATIFRFLVKVSYCRSYNYNGKYYTKHDLTRYDKQGLFSYKGIHFSRDGNLSATVARLVRESLLGHTQRELRELLRVRVQTSLLKMVHHKQHRTFQSCGTIPLPSSGLGNPCGTTRKAAGVVRTAKVRAQGSHRCCRNSGTFDVDLASRLKNR